MVFLENTQLDRKTNHKIDCHLQSFIELLWNLVKQQVPTWGCALLSQQDKAVSTIEALYLSNSSHTINYTVLNNFNLDSYELGSEVYIDSIFLGHIYPISESRYLIVFCDSILSLEQQEIIKAHNKLLENHLNLDNKLQKNRNKVKALEKIFYQMGHYLRNPLAEISIIAETICLNPTKTFCQAQAEEIKKKIINLNFDLKKFLDCQKQVINQPTKAQDIRKIFQISVNELANTIKQKNLTIKYPQKTALLAIDSFQIKQIFDNLLSNAIYFSPQGETIDCYWQSFQEEVLISICDRGCGLSPEDRKNMFLPFYSRRENGQGLGLTIVRNIILELQGKIWAENIYQGGTKISLILPIE